MFIVFMYGWGKCVGKQYKIYGSVGARAIQSSEGKLHWVSCGNTCLVKIIVPYHFEQIGKNLEILVNPCCIWYQYFLLSYAYM